METDVGTDLLALLVKAATASEGNRCGQRGASRDGVQAALPPSLSHELLLHVASNCCTAHACRLNYLESCGLAELQQLTECLHKAPLTPQLAKSLQTAVQRLV